MDKTKHAGDFRWEVELNVSCPYLDCGHDFEVTDEDAVGEFMAAAKAQVLEPVKNIPTCCPNCDRDFTFDIGGGR